MARFKLNSLPVGVLLLGCAGPEAKMKNYSRLQVWRKHLHRKIFGCWGFRLYDAGLYCIRDVLYDPPAIVIVFRLHVLGIMSGREMVFFLFLFY